MLFEGDVFGMIEIDSIFPLGDERRLASEIDEFPNCAPGGEDEPLLGRGVLRSIRLRRTSSSGSSPGEPTVEYGSLRPRNFGLGRMNVR